MSAWKTLAEALGIETEANWDKVAKQRNIQRYGAQDRRTQLDPMQYFNSAGTGAAQRQQTATRMRPDMTPKQGGLQIPTGQDRPGQLNPLYAPPAKPAPQSPLSTPPNSPKAMGSDDEDEDVGY